MFLFKNDWALNPELPVLSPWKTVDADQHADAGRSSGTPTASSSTPTGNQLPYIDKVVLTLAENLEVLNLRAIAGEYDFQARHIDLGKLPVFLENQQKGGYKVYLDPGDYGGDMIIKFNLSYEADPEIAKWIEHDRLPARAVARHRPRPDQRDASGSGPARPSSVVPADSNKYNPGPSTGSSGPRSTSRRPTRCSTRSGWPRRTREGYRLRTDGKGRLRIEIMTLGGQFLQFTQIAEMIREQWKKIGIDLTVQEVERSLALKRTRRQRAAARRLEQRRQRAPVHLPAPRVPLRDRRRRLVGAAVRALVPVRRHPGQGAARRACKELMEKWKKAFGVPEKERIQLGKEVWKIAAEEVYIIGVIGMGPASMGVRVVKTNMGNIPSRQYNSPDGKTPTISRPVTFFWKK